MTKKNLISMILGTAGGIFFAIGMCMVMVFEGMMIYGIVVGVVGIALLLCLVPMISRRS